MNKILGKDISVTPNSQLVLYTVPTSKTCYITRFVCCNQNSTSITFRVAVVKSGEVLSAKHYEYYDFTLDSKDSFVESLSSMALQSGDFVSVSASLSNVSFALHGIESDN